MINKADWLGCLLLTSLMVIVKANTNSTSVNETSNGASIDNPSVLIKVLNASADGKAIFPKLEIKRTADETDAPPEGDDMSSAPPDGESSTGGDDMESKDPSIDEGHTGTDDPIISMVETEMTDTTEMGSSMVTESSMETSMDTEEPHSKRPGAKEGSAVSFKPTLLYFVLLPLCITAKEKLLW